MSHLSDLLPPAHVTWLDDPASGQSPTKDAALGSLLNLLAGTDAVRDPNELRNAIFSREVMMSTGVGYGVAVPHARIPSVDRFVLSLGVASSGIAWGSALDDDPVRLVVMIAGPGDAREGYLRVLSTTLKFIKSEKGKILHSTSAEQVSRLAGAYELAL